MSTTTFDQSTKLILEYIDKLRGTKCRKRQKLCEETEAIRPADYPGISTQQLCDVLIRFAYNGTYIDDVFRDHLLGLVRDESLKWDQVLHSVLHTKSDRLFLKCQLCELIREMIRHVQIKSFDDRNNADALVSIIKPTFFFVTQQILDLLSDEDEMETIQIESEDVFLPYHHPLEALNTIIHDDLCSMLLALVIPSEVTNRLQQCLEAFSKLSHPDKSAISLLELLIEQHSENMKVPEFEYIPEGLALFDLKNPSIRILVPIFACFNNHESSEQMASTVQVFADIMRVSGEDVVFDLLHAAILLKCEESMDLLHLPKQHRVDFRWQSTTFFYKKLPQIIGHLISSGYLNPKEACNGLDRALGDLSMMFDAADTSWQNASFLSLLNELEPFIGKEDADSLRERRREHMKSTAHLVPFAESDRKLIENTEIEKLLNAVKEVTQLKIGQEEEFWRLLSEKVSTGDCDDFDAVTSILTVEGRLLETGKDFSLKNKSAQEASGSTSTDERIRMFDVTFLILSRILIKNPSVSIKLFVNGGLGKTEAERTIFYNWSMWYIKRVAKHSKAEPKNEEEQISLKREVEMLVRLANAEVGIEDGEEEEEEDPVDDPLEEESLQEKPKEKPKEKEDAQEEKAEDPTAVKEEEMHEDTKDDEEKKKKESEEAPEKMDTSEAEAPSTSESKDPASESTSDETKKDVEGQEKEEEKPAPESPKTKKKEEPVVTWNQVHCPLPRITKKLARVYLTQLKEGKQFWNADDPKLNLGSIVAAIPRIGKLLVEDHVEKRRHRIDRKAAEETMIHILRALDSMSCLFVCLVEWLDCEPDSPARTSLAITINGALEKFLASITPSENLTKWKFIQSTVQQMIHELVDKSPAFPEVTCTAFSTARRFCPFVARNEKPDQVKLKHAWYYMRQQGWASPHALRLLEHANIAGEYNAWSHIYINKTIKSGCGDIMKSSVDMIFSFLMLDDLNSIIRMHESLMDFWLSEDAGQCQVDGRFDPLSMRAVIRLMSQVMLIAEYTLDRLMNDGPPVNDFLKLNEPIEAPEPEDPDRREKWIFLLKSMMERTINRFFKIVRNGSLSTVVNTIIQLVKSIAGTIDCKAKRLLVRRIPPELIFQLAYIEPTSVDYSLMNVYCDPDNEEHTRTKIMFLCALRRTTPQ